MPVITYTWNQNGYPLVDANYQQFNAPANWTPNGFPGTTTTPGFRDLALLTNGLQIASGSLDLLDIRYDGAATDQFSTENLTFGLNSSFNISGPATMDYLAIGTVVNNGAWTIGAGGIGGHLLLTISDLNAPASYANAGTWTVVNGSTVSTTTNSPDATFDNVGTLAVGSGAQFSFGSNIGPDQEAFRNEGAVSVTGSGAPTTFTLGANYIGSASSSFVVDGGASANPFSTKVTFGGTAQNLNLVARDAAIELDQPAAGGSITLNGSVNLKILTVNQNAGITENPLGPVIYGFDATDAIDIREPFSSAAYDPATGRLSLIEGNGVDAVLTFGGPAAAGLTLASFNIADVSAQLGQSYYTEVTLVACFVAGAMIATPGGERPIEAIEIGEEVRLARGGSAPVRWVGRRRYAGRFLAGNTALLPILFRAGSLGGGLPRRDLRVSPQHAMFLDGVLVPAALLVNGATILQEWQCREVEYLHLELPSHDVVLAEGAASESFVDDDSRGVFHNAAEHATRHPGAAAAPVCYCAPRLTAGPALQAIRARLAPSRAA